MNSTGMRRSTFGALFTVLYPKLPFRHKLLALICRLEGGDLYSLTLRKVLNTHYDVEVGNYSYGSLLKPGFADQKTQIGSYVSIGPNVRRFGAAHPMNTASMHPFWYNPKLGYADAMHDVDRTPCSIGHDVWIGANTSILPGCRSIGIGAVIGAGSVVTRDVGPFMIVAGNPAKQIGMRLNEEARDKLLKAQPWEMEPEEMSRTLKNLQI